MSMAARVRQVDVSLSQSWKYALASCGTAVLAVVVAFWSTYSDIVKIWWRSETYAHGFIILPIVVYLIWQKRDVLLRITPAPAPVALVFVLGATLLWLLAYAADIIVAEHVAAVALIPSLIWVTVGTQVVRSIAFPLTYLFFAAPFGDFLVAPLQDITAAFSVWGLQITGIPVFWEGRFLQIPSGSFEVAQACSGIRYLIASLALGTLYAYLTYTSYRKRFAFIMLSMLVPVLANGVRAYGIIMLAYLSDYTIAVGVDHLIYGWLFFGVVMFIMIWIGSMFRDKQEGDVIYDSSNVAPGLEVKPKLFAVWTISAIVLASTSPAFANWMDTQQTGISRDSIVLPVAKNGWVGPSAATGQWNPKFVGAIEAHGAYSKDNQNVEVYLAYYPTQSQGEELIGWQNVVFDSVTSKRQDGGQDSFVLTAKNLEWAVRYKLVEGPKQQRLIWYWYEINNKPTASRFTAKLYEIQRRLFTSKNGSAALVLSTTYELTPQEAKKSLAMFLNDMLPSLRETTNQ